MEVLSPHTKGEIVDRYDFKSDYMDHRIPIVIEKREGREIIIHFRTIPPGLNKTDLEYWRDIIYERNIVRKVVENKLWTFIEVRSRSIEDAKDIADYSSEVYYDIFYHHDA